MNRNTEPYIGMPLDLDDWDCGCDCGCGDIPNGIPDAELDRPDCMAGRDFENWPIAMAYVPMQQWEETYDPDQALQAGTIFPSLDLPLLGGMK